MAKRKRQAVVVLSDDDDDSMQISSQDVRSPFQRVEEELSFLHMGGSQELREASYSSNLWIDKYRPKDVGELVGNRKKIGDVRHWLESQLGSPLGSSSKVLLITGPTGVGKKTVIRVLSNAIGVELCEWSAPAPVLWKEHLHHGGIGSKYSSKLEDFELFVETSRKYPSLSVNGQQRPKVVLIDDLPFVNGEDKRQRLRQLLHQLVTGATFPTIVVMTDVADDGGYRENGVFLFMDILQTLEHTGATKIAFNPVTVNVIKKVLTKILKAEKLQLFTEMVSQIAEIASGDVRHAILLLQFLCLNSHSVSKRRKNSSGKEIRRPSDDEKFDGRDQILSLFHALGKFLHNKRHPNLIDELSERACNELQEHYRRQPLQMESPELVISQSHAEASTLTSFLHENVLDFVDEEAIDDAAEVMQYLSSADLLGSKLSFKTRRPLLDAAWTNTSQLAEAAAASVAARGVLFANAHPAPRRWQSLRSPVLRQVERLLTSKKREVHGSLGESSAVKATEYVPFMRRISPWNVDVRKQEALVHTENDDEIEEW